MKYLTLTLTLALMPLLLGAQTYYNGDGSIFIPKNYYPNFSWDNTPQYNMFGDGSRVLTNEERAFVSGNTDFICIEKSHGRGELGYAELGAQYEATHFHNMDPENKVLFYFNSSWAWPFTSYCQYFTAEHIDNYPTLKSYLVIDQETGELFHRNGTYGWNVLNPELRTWWVETVTTGVVDAGCDGVFIDQSSGLYWYHEGGAAVVEPAMEELMANLRASLPDKFIIGNGHHDKAHLWPSCDATMFEHYKLDLLSKENLLATWSHMERIAKDNKASIFRVGVEVEEGSATDGMTRAERRAYLEQLSKDRLEYYHSVYLIGAQPYSYFQYGWGWQLEDGGALVDYPELSKSLGAPLGAYTRNGWEFTRVYENASVWVNTETKTAEITWIEDPTIEPVSNLALLGTATQSSTDFGGEASRANDGRTSGAYSGASVTHTENEDQPWWQVDLGASYRIGEISVFGRTDECCMARLTDFTVYVLDEDSTVIFSKVFASYPDPSVTMDVAGLEGRFVKVQMNGIGTLSLAEVIVSEAPVSEEEYAISIKVVDDNTNDSITVASLDINDKTYTSNFVGELALKLDEGEYPFTLSKEGYDTLFQTLDITSDTALSLQLTAIPQYTLSYKISDDSTNVDLSDVELSIEGMDYTTDDSGEVSVILYEGDYDYTLSRTGYHSIDKSITLAKDTLIALQMDRESFSLAFQVKDATTDENIQDVLISVNDSEYETDALGSLSLILDYGDYNYTLSKENYDGASGSVPLSKDTTLTILMSQLSGVNTLKAKEIEIYPNPVDDVLNIILTNAEKAKCEIFNFNGELLYSDYIVRGTNAIELGGFFPGIYLVKIVADSQHITREIVKK